MAGLHCRCTRTWTWVWVATWGIACKCRPRAGPAALLPQWCAPAACWRGPRDVLERLTIIGGGPHPLDPDFMVGKMTFTKGNIDLGYFWCTKFWVSHPSPACFSSNTCLLGWVGAAQGVHGSFLYGQGPSEGAAPECNPHPPLLPQGNGGWGCPDARPTPSLSAALHGIRRALAKQTGMQWQTVKSTIFRVMEGNSKYRKQFEVCIARWCVLKTPSFWLHWCLCFGKQGQPRSAASSRGGNRCRL